VTNDNRAAASAVLRNGDHAPQLLLGAPVACPPAGAARAATVILGWTPAGEPVLLTASTVTWLDYLAEAIQVARAQGIVEAGMEVPA
jgi:hypothetical protein